MADTDQSEVFSDIFLSLKKILSPYAKKLDLTSDDDSNYYLNTKHKMKNGKPLFFGATQIKKNYVSFHLMPVYVNPKLLKSISPALKKCMQGKSCFNLKKPDSELLKELKALTKACFDDYKKEGYV